jgi:DNA polymerase III subunit epsilon
METGSPFSAPQARCPTAGEPSVGLSSESKENVWRTCLTEMASALERTGDYRILRRLVPRSEFGASEALEDAKTCVFLDVETTGLDTSADEIVEIGLIKMKYLAGEGRFFGVPETFSAFNEPSKPLSPEITKLTGITSTMLKGQTIDPDTINVFSAGVDLVVAHNANFDRKFVERYWPAFEGMAWACSVTQLDWRSLGFESAKLTHILSHLGVFHEAHRAIDDCWALLEILSSELPDHKGTLFKALLSSARRPATRLWAERAPFQSRGRLKGRRYRWNDGSNGRPRSWFVDVDDASLPTELSFLQNEIYGREVVLPTTHLNAYTRFSCRE